MYLFTGRARQGRKLHGWTSGKRTHQGVFIKYYKLPIQLGSPMAEHALNLGELVPRWMRDCHENDDVVDIEYSRFNRMKELPWGELRLP